MSIKCMTAVWEIHGLTPSQKLVLLALADHAGDDNLCWPSVPTLARRSDQSVRNTQRILKELRRMGYVDVVDEGVGRGRTSTYQVIPDPQKSSAEKGDNQRVKGDKLSPISENVKGDTGGAKGDNQGQKGDNQGQKGDIGSHAHGEPPVKPSVEPSVEPPLPPRGGGGLTDTPFDDVSEFQKAAAAWEESGFRPPAAVIREHLTRWLETYGVDELLEAIGIAVLSEPDRPGAFVDGVLRKRAADREAEERDVRAAREGMRTGPVRNGDRPDEEDEAVRVLQQIPQLAECAMRVDGAADNVLVEHPRPGWADVQLRGLCDKTLKSAGMGGWTVSFIPEVQNA